MLDQESQEASTHNHVLVLAGSWQVSSVVDWRTATSWLVSGRAERVHDAPTWIATVGGGFRAPSVIRLLRGRCRADSNRVPRLTKRWVWYRDQGCCAYCAVPLGYRDATIDHVVPRSKGGITSWTNVVIACGKCNSRKANRTPMGAGMQMRVIPKPPRVPPGSFAYMKMGQLPDEWTPYV